MAPWRAGWLLQEGRVHGMWHLSSLFAAKGEGGMVSSVCGGLFLAQGNVLLCCGVPCVVLRARPPVACVCWRMATPVIVNMCARVWCRPRRSFLEQSSRDRTAEMYAARREIQRLQTKVMILQAEMDDQAAVAGMTAVAAAPSQSRLALGGHAAGDIASSSASTVVPASARSGGTDTRRRNRGSGGDSASGGGGGGDGVVGGDTSVAAVPAVGSDSDGSDSDAGARSRLSSAGPTPARVSVLPQPAMPPRHPTTAAAGQARHQSRGHSDRASDVYDDGGGDGDGGAVELVHDRARDGGNRHVLRQDGGGGADASAQALIRRFINGGDSTGGDAVSTRPVPVASSSSSTSSSSFVAQPRQRDGGGTTSHGAAHGRRSSSTTTTTTTTTARGGHAAAGVAAFDAGGRGGAAWQVPAALPSPFTLSSHALDSSSASSLPSDLAGPSAALQRAAASMTRTTGSGLSTVDSDTSSSTSSSPSLPSTASTSPTMGSYRRSGSGSGSAAGAATAARHTSTRRGDSDRWTGRAAPAGGGDGPPAHLHSASYWSSSDDYKLPSGVDGDSDVEEDEVDVDLSLTVPRVGR